MADDILPSGNVNHPVFDLYAQLTDPVEKKAAQSLLARVRIDDWTVVDEAAKAEHLINNSPKTLSPGYRQLVHMITDPEEYDKMRAAYTASPAAGGIGATARISAGFQEARQAASRLSAQDKVALRHALIRMEAIRKYLPGDEEVRHSINEIIFTPNMQNTGLRNAKSLAAQLPEDELRSLVAQLREGRSL